MNLLLLMQILRMAFFSGRDSKMSYVSDRRRYSQQQYNSKKMKNRKKVLDRKILAAYIDFKMEAFTLKH